MTKDPCTTAFEMEFIRDNNDWVKSNWEEFGQRSTGYCQIHYNGGHV